MYKSLLLLNAPNEELQLDYAVPLSDGAGNQVYILAAIDRFSKYQSVMLTKTTGANKILKFLENYIFTHSIRKAIRTDQYSGFKNKLVDQYCKWKVIRTKFSEKTTFRLEVTELKTQEENSTTDLTILNKEIANHVTSAGRNSLRIINFHVQQRM